MEVALHCELNAADRIDLDVAADVVSAALFGVGATAIGSEPSHTGQLVLVAGFASEAMAERARASILSSCSDLVVECVLDRSEPDWVTAQRAALRPVDIGPWHIRAPWDKPPDAIDPRFDIVIDPGRAFGHGAHPSTRLALELFIRVASTTSEVIDMGTGTGIIAIIAARLGLEVLAVEHDDDAIAAATKNIRANGDPPHESMLELITLVAEDATQLTVRQDALVVANVTFDVHRAIAPACRSSDHVIVSGILCRQVALLRELYPGHTAAVIRTHAEWASVDLIRHTRSMTAAAS